MGVEEALHFGLIPRMHRGIFAMNELPELDELVQVGLFNILEERDVQIRGYPIQFDIDVLILFSANPSTYNRSGKVIPQLKDRIGSTIHTHYPLERDLGIQIIEQEVEDKSDGFRTRKADQIRHSRIRNSPSRRRRLVPYFMKELIEEVSRAARRSKYVDHQSGVSARLSLSNYRTMVASARQRAVVLGERPAVPRISDLGHLLRVIARQARTRHDGLASNERATSVGCRARRCDRDGLQRIRRQAWPRRDRARSSRTA